MELSLVCDLLEALYYAFEQDTLFSALIGKIKKISVFRVKGVKI